MAIIFKVAGPFELSFSKSKGGKHLGKEHYRRFWARHSQMANRRGCYIFAMNAGKGSTPWYVGKATKSFKQEIFTPHKISKYQDALSRSKTGTPILYFVVYPAQPGKPANATIGSLERQLIGHAEEKNRGLLNVQGKKRQPSYRVAGLLHRGKGKPPKAAQALRSCLGL